MIWDYAEQQALMWLGLAALLIMQGSKRYVAGVGCFAHYAEEHARADVAGVGCSAHYAK